MALFRRNKKIKLNQELPTKRPAERRSIPDIAERCPHCHRILLKQQITADYRCPNCDDHLFFPAQERIDWLVDAGTFQEWDADLETVDEDNFPGYQGKLDDAQELTGLKEAVITGQAEIDGQALAIAAMDSRFIMASMGQVVGEKISRLFERATREGLAVVIYIASGGARMQEGIISLMQMAKVSEAVSRHQEAALLYVSILTNPTTGGVTASFATQADIILAEPRAVIGFAGRRVIEQTIKMELAPEFQQAEWVFDNGMIDKIVRRPDQRLLLSQLLTIYQRKEGEES